MNNRRRRQAKHRRAIAKWWTVYHACERFNWNRMKALQKLARLGDRDAARRLNGCRRSPDERMNYIFTRWDGLLRRLAK